MSHTILFTRMGKNDTEFRGLKNELSHFILNSVYPPLSGLTIYSAIQVFFSIGFLKEAEFLCELKRTVNSLSLILRFTSGEDMKKMAPLFYLIKSDFSKYQYSEFPKLIISLHQKMVVLKFSHEVIPFHVRMPGEGHNNPETPDASSRDLPLFYSLNEKFRLENNLIKVFGHDLLGPLNTVQLYISLLESGKFNPEDVILGIKDSINESRRMMEKLHDYFLPPKEKWVPVSLNELLEEVKNDLRESGEIKLTIKGPPLVLTIAREEFKSVFYSLFENSLLYNKSENCEIYVKTYKKNSRQIISVNDNGPGINIKKMERLFSFFSPLHSNNPKRHEGMGLSRARKTIMDLGGALEPVQGKGAGFKITF